MSDPFTPIDLQRRQHVGLRPEDELWIEPYAKAAEVESLRAEIDELRARLEILETELAEREVREAAP
jgi:hypothetical protein